MWTQSRLVEAKKPEFTENETRLVNEILDLLAEQGMTFNDAGDFLYQVLRELEHRFSKAVLPKS